MFRKSWMMIPILCTLLGAARGDDSGQGNVESPSGVRMVRDASACLWDELRLRGHVDIGRHVHLFAKLNGELLLNVTIKAEDANGKLKVLIHAAHARLKADQRRNKLSIHLYGGDATDGTNEVSFAERLVERDLDEVPGLSDGMER